MTLFHYFQKQPLIGLDLSGAEATFIQLLPKTQPWHIEKYAQVSIPSLWLNGGVYYSESLVAELKECVERLEIQNAEVAIALPHHCITSKRIKVPIDFNEIRDESEGLDYLKPYLTGLNDDFYMDYALTVSQEDEESTVVLFAVKQTLLDSIKLLIHAMGLRLKIVDVNTYAFSRGVMAWLKTLGKLFKQIAILCLSTSYELIYVDYPEVVFVQTWDDQESLDEKSIIQKIKMAFQMRLIEWGKN